MGESPMFMDKKTIFRMAILPKLTYRINIILIKIPAGFFAEMDKLKFIQKFKGSRWPKQSLKKNKKTKVEKLTPSPFQNLFKDTVIKN